jgi:hypothetical protein
MSKALRETKCLSFSTACARQTKPPVQRVTTSSFLAHAWLPQTGHLVGNSYGFAIGRALVEDDIDDLRDDVAGALHDHGVAFADIDAVAERLAVIADALM